MSWPDEMEGRLCEEDPASRWPPSERQIQCSYCSETFCRADLGRHMRIHTGEKPFHCSFCPLAFTQTAHLVKHERTHTGERPFRCTQCDAAFNRKEHLRRHARVHTGVVPFRCVRCHGSFSSKSSLAHHINKCAI